MTIRDLIGLSFIRFLEMKKIYTDGPFQSVLMLFPSCVLILLQSDFNYMLHYNLGFLAAFAYFLLLIKTKNRSILLIWFALFPLFYYLAGGYAWVVTGMYITYSILYKNILYPVLILFIVLLTLWLFKILIFIQPLADLVYYPLPKVTFFKIHAVLYGVFGFFIIYPAILKVLRPVKMKPENAGSLSLYIIMIVFSATILFLSKLYNPEMARLFYLEKLVCQEKWEEVIRYQEKIKSGNIVAQYYYNLALSETDQLCDRMFSGRQDYGPNSLLVQWDSRANINQIFRGAYFYYNIGLINEAHRWAFESMVMQGYRPENIKMLIRTELINGHYKIAGKYINVLKKTLRYRPLAKEYEAMLQNPDLIKKDPGMSKKINLRSGSDFLIRLKDQQANVLLLLQSNPGNARAYEYMMAWFMLEKNVEKVVSEIGKMNGLGYERIPRHIEEATLLFIANSGKLPDLGNLRISDESISRFSLYNSNTANMNISDAQEAARLQKSFGNTFWYYIEFR